MQNECPNKKDDKGNKVLQTSMSDNESISEDEDMSQYCFMEIDDNKYLFEVTKVFTIN